MRHPFAGQRSRPHHRLSGPLRWFVRYLDEGKGVTLLKAQLALSALAELRAAEREQAANLLSELVRG